MEQLQAAPYAEVVQPQGSCGFASPPRVVSFSCSQLFLLHLSSPSYFSLLLPPVYISSLVNPVSLMLIILAESPAVGGASHSARRSRCFRVFRAAR
eukprot:768423-Hanusia_phi.AAC.3